MCSLKLAFTAIYYANIWFYVYLLKFPIRTRNISRLNNREPPDKNLLYWSDISIVQEKERIGNAHSFASMASIMSAMQHNYY